METNQGHAGVFRRLHEQGLLVLVNAWDAGSARLIESLGAKAIATTSAGVAWAHGYPDGDALPVRLLSATVGEIARVVHLPITVDVEGGYSEVPARVGETVAGVIDAGAVGINIEDGAGTSDLLCAKIERAKEAGVRRGVDLFVNARTDVYLRSLVSPARRLEETLARAGHYRAAGADGIFVPALVDRAEIAQIAAAVKLPLNVLTWPGLPAPAELEALGARRLSAGSSVATAVLGLARSLVRDFVAGSAPAALAEGAMTYAEINALMAGD